jgi:hypothetical protein
LEVTRVQLHPECIHLNHLLSGITTHHQHHQLLSKAQCLHRPHFSHNKQLVRDSRVKDQELNHARHWAICLDRDIQVLNSYQPLVPILLVPILLLYLRLHPLEVEEEPWQTVHESHQVLLVRTNSNFRIFLW